VDAAFAAHNDMRGHSGAIMTMGQGTIVGISNKQKINTKSTTEAELVGVDEPLSLILWSRMFAEAQGMRIKDNILYQDNMSAIRMERYGKRSCTKRTRHINIRYFFICDKVNNSPTTEMIADYFSKPLGGSQFRKMRNLVLGIDEKDMSDYRFSYRNHPN